MKIEVGDYVRTKYGVIAKITDIIEDLSIDCDIDVYYEDNLKDKMPMTEIPYNLKDEYIIKSSPNIIDLIEKGDYVNGVKVEAVDYTEDEQGNYIDVLGTMEIEDDFAYPIILRNENIKSIVTKEQFNNMEYRV